jgi:peptidoglycan/LPS O-acetylase OafA/YrhL
VIEHTETGLRKDIQALRAIAVLAVFAYHLWPKLLPGGFVGVDVFFVISGFLITGNLIREADRTGGIRIWRFWSRRARRLLPAALTVLLASAIGVYLWVPQNLWPQFLRESIAATLYVQNWALAADSVDYLAANNTASPAQHFWTLSAEEQFYIFTPLLLIAILFVARRLRSRHQAMLAGIAAVTVASFAYSIWLTAVSAPTAYFATTTRAWEFGVGALLVFAPGVRSLMVGRLAVGLGLLGVVSSTVILSNQVPFPGATAAWPVLATAAVIWGGPAMGRRWESLAGFAPVQFIGRISYSTYLWHWPLIVIAPYLLDHELNGIDKVAILALTLVLAALSTRYIEDPIRYSSRLLGGNRSPLAIGAWGAAGMAFVVAVSGFGLASVEAKRVESVQRTAAITQEAPQCLGGMAIVNADRCGGVIPADLLVPDPAQASADSWNRADCWASVDSAELHVCSFGPADAAVRLAAIGDSHNNGFLAAYQAIAEKNGWRIDVAGHNGCYLTTAVQKKPTQAMVDGCEAWKANLTAYLDSVAPYDALLVTNARNGLPPNVAKGVDVTDATVQGLVAAWARQTARGTRIIAIRDNPAMRNDVVTCVVKHGLEAAGRCAVPAATGLGARDALVEAVGLTENARVVDMTDIYCPGEVCLPIIGHVVVYQNKDHLTVTFVTSLIPVLSDRIKAALP